jgi:uncharacterized protein
LIDDPYHSADEERFLLLGYGFQSRCRMVCRCYQEADSVIRRLHSAGVRSCMKTAHEEKEYWSFQ